MFNNKLSCVSCYMNPYKNDFLIIFYFLFLKAEKFSIFLWHHNAECGYYISFIIYG